jgi:DNA polymerase-3 subunit epsilon
MALLPYQIIPDNWDAFYSEQTQKNLSDSLGAFYQQKLASLEQSVIATDFVALDIETTGLDAQKDDIVSIGLVPFNSQRIYLAKAKHWVVSSRRLTSDSVLSKGISHSEVAEAPSLVSVLPEILANWHG